MLTPDRDTAWQESTRRLTTPDRLTGGGNNRTLIVAESWAECLTAYDIADDGGLSRRRVWASTPDDHPDGISLDAEGAVWYADVGNAHCVRVREGGRVLDTVALDRGAFACMLARPRRSEPVRPRGGMARLRERRAGDRGRDRSGPSGGGSRTACRRP
jgi:sugar lactone lactonase YvrE